MLRKLVLVVAIALAFGGAWVGMRLTAMHIPGTATPAWFAETCAPDDNPTYNCKEVLKSKWAVFNVGTFSFVDPDPETGEQAGTPVALFGWFYFSAVLVWYVLIGRVDYERRRWHDVLLVVVGCACAVSAFFVYVLFTRMDVRCIWCLVSHGTNFAMLGCTIFLRPRRSQAAVESVAGSTKAADSQEIENVALDAHPTSRLIFATFACIVAVLFGELTIVQREGHKVRSARYRLEAAGYKQEMDRIREDTDTQLAWFQAQKAVDLKHRSDDPRRGEGKMLLPIVIFSDFECPHCARFADELEKKIIPAFDNMLRVYWKHYPLSNECNPNVKRNIHKYACEAAYASEAARIQGGNDGFWKAHDALFAARKKLATLDWKVFATELDLDPDRFVADMASDAVKQRVAEDIELGKSVGVTGTPGIFLWGRKIQRYMLSNRPFVDEIKKSFLQVRASRLKQREHKSHQHKQKTHDGK